MPQLSFSPPNSAIPSITVWTVGHSTRGIDVFIAILKAFDLAALADVRRFPGSRRFPHFGAGPLKTALAAAGIDYMPFPERGGRRRPRPDSVNTAWTNAGFRGYADYTQTAEFQTAVKRLLQAAARRRTVMMCAERLWWRCHRALIADCLQAGGVNVLHIEDAGTVVHHPFTEPAHVENGALTYQAQVRTE